VNLAIVVQRYGQAINGGAELHARYIAEHLTKHANVEVLTTCAADYVTWRNEFAPGVESVNGVRVRRFRVRHERDPLLFGRRSKFVFEHIHSLDDELKWIDAEGPTAPELIAHLGRNSHDYDYCLFFSYRYYHALFGARAAALRAILVPTAERDATIGLAMFKPVFRGVRALMYNSPEERRMIQAVSGNHDVPNVVVGVGSEILQNPQPNRFRQKFGIHGPFAVYIGRIDENKGCVELFESFQRYLLDPSARLSLVLVGHSLLRVPDHPRIRHVGFLGDTDKFDALAAADVLIMPSHFESLSMVTLEAWALGRPVLANGKCDVLKGQCLRSNAGLYYETPAEFLAALRTIEHNGWLGAALGRNGRQFFREHYDWPVVERKYLDMLQHLSRVAPTNTIAPLPGWLERRRRNLPPSEEVVAGLPTGPAREVREPSADADEVSDVRGRDRDLGPERSQMQARDRASGHLPRPFSHGRGHHRSRRGSGSHR
jgi:glycosyltransferase involved in cell wall biosynthesis